MHNAADLWTEAQEALERVWFVQSVEETERTGFTLSVRLRIQSGLFVQAFIGELSGSLYLALIQGDRRIFGVDREGGDWHVHPFTHPHDHEPLPQGLEPKPLLKFLSQVEDLLLQRQLL